MATIRAIAAWFTARRLVVAGVMIGWVLLVIVGAGRTPTADPLIGIPDLGNVFLVALGVYAVLAVTLLVFFRPARAPARQRKTRGLKSLLLVTLFFVVLASVFPPVELTEEPTPTGEESSVSQESGEVVGVVSGPPEVSGSDIAVLTLILLIAAAVLVRSRSRYAAPSVDSEELQEDIFESDLGLAFDEAAVHLRTDGDPRMSVMAAYASLEDALAQNGHFRDPAQTPSEFLADVLAALPSLAGPAAQLGHLYELARFSRQVITQVDRDQAADALAAARLRLFDPVGVSP